MKVFFDTSVFVKRYVEESGSDQVQDICANNACCPESTREA